MIVIGLAGKSGSGKTTMAKWLSVNLKGYNQVYSFADPVKKIARECFCWNGDKDAAGRRLLQVIGTDAGRMYNQNIWVEILAKELASSPHTYAIIDDVRFDNEACMIKDCFNGYVFNITGRGGIDSNHASEKGINEYDEDIDNSGDLAKSCLEIIDYIEGAEKW